MFRSDAEKAQFKWHKRWASQVSEPLKPKNEMQMLMFSL